jgi:hypothetical protein
MRVSDLIAWLQTQDPAAVVAVVEHRCATGYYDQGGTATTAAFDPAVHAEVADYRDNRSLPQRQRRVEILLGVYNG